MTQGLMDQMFRRKADVDGIGAYHSNGFRPSENPVASVLAMSVRHSLPKQITELFEWDPTEPVATRPMFMQSSHMVALIDCVRHWGRNI